MNFYITGILLVSTRVQLVASDATLTLPTSVNCGDPAVLTCTSSGCGSGYRFARNNVTVYNKTGPAPTISDPDRYSANVTSDTQVQLTITNIQYSDAVEYACTCGFNLLSTGQTMVYQCKASTSSASVTSDKKVSITVDRLYPEPSSIVTTNTTNTLQGAHMCRSSSTLALHFMCSWNSTTSFPDGIHNYTITVTTGTQAAPVSGSFRILTPTSPNISNLVTISNNRQVLRSVQDKDTPLSIECVSKGGIPAPTLAWYRNIKSAYPLKEKTTSNTVQQPDGKYTVHLTHRFYPTRSDDMTPFLCGVFYPGATSGASPDPSPATAILYLDLKPSSPIVSQTGEAVSGGNITLQCSTTNGRPAPTIEWDFQGQKFTTTNNETRDPTSETYTVVSVLQRPVSAVDNEKTAACSVHQTSLKFFNYTMTKVDVKFGPTPGTVAISGNKTTPATGANLLRLNCTSGSSNPASNITWYNGSDVIPNTEGYTRWRGNNNGMISSNILTITPTRYVDGDRVTCRSDNGYGSDSTYVNLDILYPCLIQTLPNVTAIEGEQDVTLTCSASSKPPANFTWYKGNTILANGIGSLTSNTFSYVIPRVDRSYGGSYTCRAGNNVGSPDSKIANLIVKFGPTPGTVAISGNKTRPATCANMLRLNCTSGSSNPASNITWYNGSDVIPNTEGYTRWPGNNNGLITSNILTITPTRFMDGDIITCRSDNGYGSDSTYVDLDVLCPPSTPTITDLNFVAGQIKLTIVPGYHGELNQTIVVQTSTDHKTWHNSSSVNVGKVLSHTTLEISNYVRAYAFNSEGQSQNYSAVLNVSVKQDECTHCSSISSTVAASVSTTAFITIILCIVVIVIVIRRYPNLIMRILQHTCPGNEPKGNETKTVMQSQTSTELERQMVFSTLVAAENPTRGENVEATPAYESLNQTRNQPVYTSLEATAYENLKRQ